MKQLSLSIKTQNLFDLIASKHTLAAAFESVRKNKGSPGIDNVTIKDFDKVKDKELALIQEELCNWSYKPMPVRRVEIPKPGNKGIRLLGVPTVRDRVVQAAIKIVIEPILDITFSKSSFGFRPELGQIDAIEAARLQVEAGKEYVVDIDLSKFFDRINHDKIIAKLGKVIQDKRVLRLIGLTLRSGAMTQHGFEKTTTGSTQGSPLSPLLSNIILDELDKKLEKRGLSFVRYADDCNIFVKTRKAAERVMENITNFIEKKMKLVVNQEKSQVAKSHKVKFLGVTIVKDTIAIAKVSMQRAKSKIKELIPRGSNKTLEETVLSYNSWYKGWSGYFDVTYYPAQFKTIEAYARRRLRARIISQSKRRKFLFNKLKKRGVKHKTAAKTVFSNKKRWALSKSKALEIAFSNKYFEMTGMFIKSKEAKNHWFGTSRWIHLS